MPVYLFLFLDPRDETSFPQLRRQFFTDPDSGITHRLYLTSNETNLHVNVYRFIEPAESSLKRLDSLKSDPATSLVTHWRLYSSLTETSGLVLSAPTIVTVEMTVADTAHQELERWYTDEHFPALSTVPGWQAAARMKLYASGGDEHGNEHASPYLALHEWAEPNGLGGEMWKKAVFTPWTEKINQMQSAPMWRVIWNADT